ncbi:hypothetical protein ACNKHW_13190 [Shigella flexneri]
MPLAYFAQWRPANARRRVNHQGLSAASTIGFDVARGYSLSDAETAVDNVPWWSWVCFRCAVHLPEPHSYFRKRPFSGAAHYRRCYYRVYLVGMLYESFIHPLTIYPPCPPRASAHCLHEVF